MNYKIPLFELNFDREEEKAVVETLRSKWISLGPKTQELEEHFADMMNARYAVAVTNCTAALHLAMVILGIGEGDEVICPSLTFVATVNAIRYVNAKPVFCDITSNDDLNVNPALLELLITKKTRAIIVMHYGGFPCRMKDIMKTAKKYKLKVVEDACHAPLSEYQGSKLGTIGDIGCFSFFSNKNISTGEGGMLVTKHEEYSKKAKLLRSHGMTTLSYERSKGHSTSYDVVSPGYNYRMDDIRSAIGIVQLKKLKKDLIKRAVIRDYYVDTLSSLEHIILPFQKHNGFVSNYIFPIVLKNSNQAKRDIIRQKLHSKGIQTSVHYPAVHRFTTYRKYKTVLPVTEYVSDNEITLPLYSNLTKSELKYITSAMKAIL